MSSIISSYLASTDLSLLHGGVVQRWKFFELSRLRFLREGSSSRGQCFIKNIDTIITTIPARIFRMFRWKNNIRHIRKRHCRVVREGGSSLSSLGNDGNIPFASGIRRPSLYLIQKAFHEFSSKTDRFTIQMMKPSMLNGEVFQGAVKCCGGLSGQTPCYVDSIEAAVVK